MYIKERLIGVSVYFLMLLITCLLIKTMKRSETNKILNIYIVMLALMGFFYVPASGADLYRIIPIMRNFSQANIMIIINQMTKTITPIATLYYFAIGKLGIDGFLPAITVLITYSNIFYILKKSIKYYNVENKNIIALSLFFIMSTGFFLEVISNIRTLLAFSIVARCVYNEIYREKPVLKNLGWYLIAAMIHTSSLAFLIIRLCYILLFENKNNFIKFITILGIITGGYFIFKDYIKQMINMVQNYFQFGTYFWIWEYIKTTILIIELFIIIHKCNKKQLYINELPEDKPLQQIVKFTFILNIIIISCCSEFNIYMRFTYLNTILAIPEVIYVLKNYKRANRFILIISMVVLILSLTRGNLSSLKFFEI